MFPVLLVLGVTLGLAALAGRARAAEVPVAPPPVPPKPAPFTQKLPRGLTPEYVALAKKYGMLRKLPVQWILQTILVESGGKPKEIGDAGKSYGLMQVNHEAHADLLKQLGIAKERLFEPEINIAIGTYLMRQFVNDLVKTLRAHPSKAPFDEIMRLAYKGPYYVQKALEQGRDPRAIAWAPQAIKNWQTARAATQGIA